MNNTEKILAEFDKEFEYKNIVLQGDSLEILKTLEENSVDSIVTDPPYGLSFMGKVWDYDVPTVELWKEAIRVLKPGGHLLSFAGSRTYHRMAVNIEDAGFEIRDQIMWVYGSGFPKSHNLGKSVNSLETKEWSKISNALDNIDQKTIIELWKTNAKLAEIKLAKSLTGVGSNTQKKYFVPDIAVLYFNQKNKYADAITAELSLCVPSRISEENLSIAVESVEQNTELSQNLVKSVIKLSQDRNHKSWSIFTAECNVREWLNENTTVNLKVDEALKTLRGNQKYSNEEITNVLCVLLTDTLKLTILNQSKTFQSLDTNSQMECVSATNVIITEYTMECLISNMVDILIGKAVDKLQGNEREDLGEHIQNKTNPDSKNRSWQSEKGVGNKWDLSKGISPYEGWGTALKPAHEPICMARKPLSESTIAENVLKWGTGGINIDGCRVGTEEKLERVQGNNKETSTPNAPNNGWKSEPQNQGRFPANFIHDGSDEVVGLFPESKSTIDRNEINRGTSKSWFTGDHVDRVQRGDSGSASRFFYCAKASKKDRNEGLEGFETSEKFTAGNYSQSPTCKTCDKTLNGTNDHSRCSGEVYYKEMESKNTKNNHPTVKPTSLMQYLVRLVTPKGGTVLDPFTGSGSTGKACVLEGFDFIGIELDPEYVKIAEARIASSINGSP